jgi:xanthine dehydrogenase accessory factor
VERTDLSVLTTAIDWCDAGHRTVLVTVAKTWGSAPRPLGSMLVWRDDGSFEGSVSGGCVEDDLFNVLKAQYPDAPRSFEYGVSREQAVRRGLPCGGNLIVVAEPLESSAELKLIVAAVEKRERVVRELDVATGKTELKAATPQSATSFDGEKLKVAFGPEWRLCIIGAGQLSKYVCHFAKPLGFEIFVCDPRENYRRNWEDPQITLSAEMPDDFIIGIACDEHTAVVALTHDPKLDDLAIMEALTSPAFYVGALGSMRTNDERRKRLTEHFDLDDATVARLVGPIGVDLNSSGAAEIALAAVADIIARRNNVMLSSERLAAVAAQ